MGFDLAQVISDDKHYGPFVCGVCQHLVSLDAVVTPCSHVACRQCLTAWSENHRPLDHKQAHGGDDDEEVPSCPCPSCQADISGSKFTMVVHDDGPGSSPRLAALPLLQAQPIAYQVLVNVQVACIDRTDRIHCEWSGDYVDFLEHAYEHGDACAALSFVDPPATMTAAAAAAASPAGCRRSPPQRSLSSPSVISVERKDSEDNMFEFEGDDDDSDDGHMFDSPVQMGIPQQQKQRGPVTPGPLLRKSLSLKDLGSNRNNNKLYQGTTSGPLDEMNKSSPSITALASSLNASIASLPEARKDHRERNGGVAQPSSPSSGEGAAGQRERDAPPCMVQRTVSEDGSLAGVDTRFGAGGGKVRSKKRNKPAAVATSSNQHDDTANDLEMSYSHALDWNMSYNSSYREPPMETLEEEHDEPNDFSLVFELEANGDGDFAVNTKKTTEKAEKLKKQANAKFNKGDFAAARNLYTDGINVMAVMTAVTVVQRDLLSNMHSNRAVTFFREKKFEECIHDCDKAIGYDPTYDKSWIRKWRAVMALGNFDSAYECLQLAAQTVPGSKRIAEEFNKCAADKKIIDEARAMLEKGEYQAARDMLKPYSRNSDNLGLLLLASKADAGLGNTESALEKVNRALRFNPSNTEGLEVRGYILFLTGETEKGAHLLQDAYGRNRDNRSIRLELMRCQKTHSALSKGRACVKRGRYTEAVEHFSNAIKESGRVPLQAPLFGQLRTERAEAFLLSKKYMEALKDCDEALNAQQENATAWSVRAEILIALGKAEDAKKELERIRCTWGADNPTIEEGYRRVDFELRVLKEDTELMKFVDDLESGLSERLPFELERKAASRKSARRSKSAEELEGDSPRSDNKKEKVRSKSTTKDRHRSSGERRARSKSRAKDPPKRDHDNRSAERVAVPPPSNEDLNNGTADPLSDRRGSSGKENKRRPNLDRRQSERGMADARPRRSQSAKRLS